MKTVREFVNESSSKGVRKTIISSFGRKNGDIISLVFITDNDKVINVNWKDWKKSTLKDDSDERQKKEFKVILVKQLKTVIDKSKYIQFIKNDNPNFEETVDWLLNNGCKYTKNGLKK